MGPAGPSWGFERSRALNHFRTIYFFNDFGPQEVEGYPPGGFFVGGQGGIVDSRTEKGDRTGVDGRKETGLERRDKKPKTNKIKTQERLWHPPALNDMPSTLLNVP